MGAAEDVRADRLDAMHDALAATPIALIATDVTGTVTHWSPHAERLYGWTPAEALGRPIQDLTVGPTSAAVAERIMAQVGAGRAWEGEFPARRRDGTTVDVHVVDLPVRDATGTTVGVVGLSFDVTAERGLLESETDVVEDLALAAAEVREQERARIARELHDDLGQYLTMVRTELLGLLEARGSWWAGEGSVGELPADDRRSTLDRILALTDAGLDRMHRIIEDLGPRDLETSALDSALVQLVRDTAARTGWTIDVAIDVPPVTRTVARTAYRVAQGLLTNCERHAGATHVRVALDATGGALRLTVTDDGVGIPPDADGFGLTAMRVRAAEHGGRLAVSPGDGGTGTIAELHLPLDPHGAAGGDAGGTLDRGATRTDTKGT